MDDLLRDKRTLADNMKCRVTLSFHPSYNSRHFGADSGKRYHCHPLYRIETDMMVAKGLHQEFGEYGLYLVKEWSLRTLRVKLIKIGAKVVKHARYVTFQMAEVLVSKRLFEEILERIHQLKPVPIGYV